MSPRGIIQAALRRELIDECGGHCPVCGATDVPLEIHHPVPLHRGGSNERANLIVLCPNCHAVMHSSLTNEVEFVAYLAHLMREHRKFRNVQDEGRLGIDQRLRADLLAERKTRQGWEKLLIECKRASFFRLTRLREAIRQIGEYQRIAPDLPCVLAFPGRVSDVDRQELLANQIEPWDIEYLSTTFREQIKATDHPYFKRLFLSVRPSLSDTPERKLLNELAGCRPGQRDWVTFQRLVGRILQHLFCPPLEAPLPESWDQPKINRRDWILPNYAPDGFWRFMRDTYRADYIVVDAKNYKGKVKKEHALQVANYLKAHGSGLFGLIVSRNGGDRACHLTIREQWMTHRKLILVLTDQDTEAMLLSASSGGRPEDVIGLAIQDFRLSM